MKSMRVLTFISLISLALIISGCFESNDVKIGVILPTDGSLAQYGHQIRSGIEVAYEEISARKGEEYTRVLNKGTKDELEKVLVMKNYELIWKNEDENNLKSIEQAFNELKEAGVTAIIGPSSSAGVLHLTPLANAAKIPLISPSASSPEINEEGGDWIFRNYPSDTLEAQKLSSTAFNKMLIQKMLMVRAESTFAEGITYQMLRFGRQNSKHIPNYVVKFSSTEEVNWAEKVDQIVAEAPQALFLAAYTDQLVPLIKEIRSRDELKNTFLFTCSAFTPEDALEQLPKETLEGLMFTAYEWDPDSADDNIKAFVEKFQTKGHVKPGIFAAMGYDALHVTVEALNDANHIVRDEILNAFNKVKYVSPISGEVDFNKRGDVTRIPLIYQIKDGAKAPLSNEDVQAIKDWILENTNT